MMEMLQLMILPTSVSEAPPQILLGEDGLWRDTNQLPIVETQTQLRTRGEQFLADVMRMVGGNPPQMFSPDRLRFQSLFVDLYQKILPGEVRAAIENLDQKIAATEPRPQLYIFFQPGAEWIPWELFKIDSGYLGTRFGISRLPLVRQSIEVRPPRNQMVNKVYSLLARDVLQDQVMNDWTTTFDGYVGGNPAWESRFPNNGGNNYPTMDQFEEAQAAGIIHLTCHGGLKDEDSGEYFWTLDENNQPKFDFRITRTIARQARLRNRPLVFGNACSSAAGGSGEFAAYLDFGTSFLVGGALNFVGTFAPITKTMAVAFAKRFYSKLLGVAPAIGLPIAEALRATKESFAVESCTDPSYLFYSLYGPPDSTYRPA